MQPGVYILLAIGMIYFVKGKQPVTFTLAHTSHLLNAAAMFKNYLKTGLRNLWKNKGFSAINIIGLASGLAVCLLITLFVLDEFSYDKFHKKAGRIYRLDADIYFNNTTFDATVSPEPMGPALVKDFPQIETYVRTKKYDEVKVKKGNEQIMDKNLGWVDSTFFKVFSYTMLYGDPNTALDQPKTMVIDETTARKYFNKVNVVGQTMTVDGNDLVKITGVIKDMPKQSHFHFRFLRPFRDFPWRQPDEWLSNDNQTYVLVKPGVTQEMLQKNVNALVNNYLSKALQFLFKQNIDEISKQGSHFRYPVMPITDIHLNSNKSYELEANGDKSYVYIFSVIAGLILLIACVNFMNLSTARSAGRAKEVGIRKVAGSLRSNLIVQFLVESLLITVFSMALAIGIALLILPFFNQLAGKELDAGRMFSSWFMPIMLALVLVVGLLAGSYPAFYLSSFRPIQVLKGKLTSGFKRSKLRSTLVVFQFSISIILIIGTITIFNQLNYIQSRKIGFDRSQVLVLHNTWPLDKQIKTFRELMLKIPGVENAAISHTMPTQESFAQNAWFRTATMDAEKAVITNNMFIDENYIPTLGMELAQGRNFSKDFGTDTTAIIVNEAAAKLLGWKEPLREQLYSPRNNYLATAYQVVGVVKDFNFSSMRNKVAPMILMNQTLNGKIALRVNPKNIASIIKQVENTWRKMIPGEPFTYTFMDADFNNLYKSEQRTGKLFISFAVFAIFIACLGLLGLVTYAAEQRTKEIGIRKVLGARVTGLVALLSGDFAKLVLIASLISFPIAWYMMYKWLEDFAYRVSISWWVFAIAGVSALAIALITVSFQAIKAALANPVAALRSE